MYLICFGIFALVQIPCALSPNIETLVVMRTIAGFFGSVGIANGGGSLSDMFEPGERAGVFGMQSQLRKMESVSPYPSLAFIRHDLLISYFSRLLPPRTAAWTNNWPSDWWCDSTKTRLEVDFLGLSHLLCPSDSVCLLLLEGNICAETACSAKSTTREGTERCQQIPIRRRGRPSAVYQAETLANTAAANSGSADCSDHVDISGKRILLLKRDAYAADRWKQAILFATTYSLYTNFQPIYQGEYGFNTEQVGLLYLGPGIGFLFCVWFIVPRIDTVYNKLAARNDGKGTPEYRLPLANIGAIFLPVSLFWFAWAVEDHTAWYVSIISTFFYGIGQVIILNSTTNYYIDCFESYAASAIAAGAVFRSVVGGIVPLFAPALFERLGYGW